MVLHDFTSSYIVSVIPWVPHWGPQGPDSPKIWGQGPGLEDPLWVPCRGAWDYHGCLGAPIGPMGLQQTQQGI